MDSYNTTSQLAMNNSWPPRRAGRRGTARPAGNGPRRPGSRGTMAVREKLSLMLTLTVPPAKEPGGASIIAKRRARRPLSGRFHVGTAAWANPPSERPQRPSGYSHLEHYASLFNSVEINSSFYRSHQHSTYAKWRNSTPAKFAFSVKLPRTVTHDCALQHCRKELQQFLGEVIGLGSKLHVLLVQLPPSLPYQAGVAMRFFKSLSQACEARVACEPRHASWFTPSAEATLKRFNVARVAADPARTPTAHLPGGSKKLVYYRLHGSPRMYYSAYRQEYLAQVANNMRGLSTRTQEVWCVFDNTARYEAWPNAQQLSKLLGATAAERNDLEA